MKNTIILLCLILTACGGKQIVSQPVAMKDAPVTIPSIDPIKTSPVQWQVLTPADLKTFAKTNPNSVIYGLDQTNFQNLSLNLSEATRYMKQEKAVDKMLSDIVISRQNEQDAPKK